MSALAFGPVTAVPVGQVACATTLWTSTGRLHLTLVVKARFRLQQNAVMTPLPAAAVQPERGEVAPYLTHADVVVSAAHAHPPNSEPVSALGVRLAVSREWAVVDKTLLAYGRDAAGGRAAAVDGALPLVSPARGKRLGILVNPHDPSRPDRLGPLPPDAPERVALMGGAAPPTPEKDVLRLPQGFSWVWFQVAPPDQRTSYLQGDEWIVLDGMHPSERRIQSRLPSARAQAYAYPPGLSAGASYPVMLQADQLFIDADRLECELLWRGSFPVADEATARALVLVAGVAIGGTPIAWPDVATLLRSPYLPAQAATRPATGGRATGGRAPRPLIPRRRTDEDDESSAKTVVRNPAAAAAMFAELEADLDDESTLGPIEGVEVLGATSDGVLFLETLDDSAVLEAPDALAGDAAPPQQLARHDDSMLLSRDGLEASKPPSVERPSAVAPKMDDHSVDELEQTLSGALLARGLKIEDIDWTDPWE
jgi:hypothetical protein